MNRLPMLMAAGLLSIPGAALADGAACNAERGRQTFLLCESCHATTSPESTNTGPSLLGLFGRKAGTLKGYEFSAAMTASGIVWNKETLMKYLEKPSRAVPGTTMTFIGIKDPAQRADLVCYLEQATRPAKR